MYVIVTYKIFYKFCPLALAVDTYTKLVRHCLVHFYVSLGILYIVLAVE